MAVARHQAEPKERAPGWLLRRIPYVGPALSRKLIAHYGTSIAALNAPEEEWREMHVPERVIEAWRKAKEE